MQPNEALYPDRAVQSVNGRYTLVYQGDGNLVLYKNYRYHPPKALWASNTNGRPAGLCHMQGDGNLVIYGPSRQYVWDSATNEHAGSGLVVQDDGNVVIYRPDGVAVWATNTVQPALPPTGPDATGDRMLPGQVLHPGQSIGSTSGGFALDFQADGNLVLYRRYNDGERKALWASNTAGRPAEVCIMQHDGNLVIYGPDGEYVWDSATDGNPGAMLVVQSDGNLVVCGANGTLLWATDTPRIDLFHPFGGSNGWLQLTLRPDGNMRFTGHAHNGRIESVDFRMRAVVRSSGPVAIVAQKTGHLGNWLTGGSPRDKHWDEVTFNQSLKDHYELYERSGTLQANEEREGRISGTVWDAATHIVDVAVRWLVGTVLITPGIGQLILVGVELGSLIGNGSLTSGARIIEGVLWMMGPYGTIYSMVGGYIAHLGESVRRLTDTEYRWAQELFAGTLPSRDKIVVTDTIGGNGQPFVFPRLDGTISMNLGPQMYWNPLQSEASEASFAHELAHVWQIEHCPFGITWLADALSTQICQELGTDSYDPGTPGPPFHSFNLEQQAEMVERWHAGKREANSPWYAYIEGNFRMGRYY